jgi:hypothetical protein
LPLFAIFGFSWCFMLVLVLKLIFRFVCVNKLHIVLVSFPV